MSIQLANGEKILRSYDYATSVSKGIAGTDGSKTLVITNKRIIHKENQKGKKSSGTNISEMPVSAAKYVRTNFKETRYPIFLIIGIILAIVAVVSLIAVVASGEDFAAGLIPFIIIGIIAAIFIIIYLKKKTHSFSCSIDTDTHITNAFGFSSVSGDSRTSGLFAAARRANNSFYIKVKVNAEVAQQMADELGYVIAAAANGDFDEIAEPAVNTAE